MNIQTKAGKAEPLPLSDIQENNKLLKILIIAVVSTPIILIIIIYLYFKHTAVLYNFAKTIAGYIKQK